MPLSFGTGDRSIWTGSSTGTTGRQWSLQDAMSRRICTAALEDRTGSHGSGCTRFVTFPGYHGIASGSEH